MEPNFADDLLSALQRLRFDGHAVIVIHVIDPAEEEFPFDGNVRFESLESDDQLLADARQVRRSYVESFRRFRHRLEDACLTQQIDYLAVRTSDRPDVALIRLLASGARGH